MNKKLNLIQFMVIVFMIAVLTACTNGRDDKQGMDNANKNMRNISTDENTGNNENQDNRLDVADEAADQVVQLKEVRQANVIVTDDNAYVAAVLEDGDNGKLTKQTEKKIADRVKSTDPDINDVFVSTNPDFFDRVQKYVNDIQAGKPVTGFVEEFSEMVRRLFPTQR